MVNISNFKLISVELFEYEYILASMYYIVSQDSDLT